MQKSIRAIVYELVSKVGGRALASLTDDMKLWQAGIEGLKSYSLGISIMVQTKKPLQVHISDTIGQLIQSLEAK